MKRSYLVVAAAVAILAVTTTAFAAVWRNGEEPNQNRWWYDNENGTWAENQWVWIDGNNDGVAECYAFDNDGWMYANTNTPDGYQVNEDGAWVVDGVVQTQASNSSRILIAYYTLPETEGTDTDAGASRVAVNGQVKGNMEYMAEVIAQTTGGELFQIDTVQAYPGLHDPLVDQAAEELDRNARPQLSTHINNLDDYDVIFVGYPIWWGEMPMPLYSFFDEYDFSGKTIVPFSSHGGSGFSGTPSEISRLEPGANVLSNGFTTSRGEVAGSADSVRNWANGLGLN